MTGFFDSIRDRTDARDSAESHSEVTGVTTPEWHGRILETETVGGSWAMWVPGEYRSVVIVPTRLVCDLGEWQ